MRKGKKILALASIFAGVALVGTTFAAWAVTDNAPILGWKISGDSVETDSTTKFVTLEYGESTSYNSVGNLEPGELRAAATIQLKATFAGAVNYYGRYSITMSQTKNKATENPKYLIDYVKIYTVDKALDGSNFASGTTTYVTLNGSGETPVLEGHQDFQMTTETEKTVYVVVELLDTVTPSILSEIKTDLVDVSVNWDHTSDHDQGAAVTSVPVYLKFGGTLNEGKVYCYAWGGKNENRAYPGVEMVDEGNGLYSYQLDTSKYSKVIFTNNLTGDNAFKTAEAGLDVIAAIGASTPCWDATAVTPAWIAKPVADSTLTAEYYVVGDFYGSNWACVAANAMTKHTSPNTYYESPTYHFVGGEKLKVRNNSNSASAIWIQNASTWDNCHFTIDDDMNVVISIESAGDYVVRYTPDGANNNFITIDPAA